jgi:hypothetical protein
VRNLLSGEVIEQQHRGLLPFRVWPIFDAMVGFVRSGQAAEFVCAAGVLTHYIGDACQPLHISMLHDGDPEQPVTRTVHHRNGTVEEVQEPKGKGLHAAYEDDMVNAHRGDILDGLEETTVPKAAERIQTGFIAAKRTIELMHATLKSLPPKKILKEFLRFKGKKADCAEDFWDHFGTKTNQCMQDGTHLLAVLWESAWETGGGEQTITTFDKLMPEAAVDICADPDFIPSRSIEKIGELLQRE